MTAATRQRLLFGVLCVVWGLNWLAMKAAISSVPPGFLSGTRWTFAGLVLLFGPQAAAGRLDTGELLGAIGITVGNLLYCYGSVLARPMMRVISPVLLTATTNFTGGGILLAFSLVFEPGVGHAITGRWGVEAWAGWLYMVMAGSLGATVIYLFLVRDWGASRTGTYAFISPVIAIIAGMVVLGERLDAIEAAGMVLMLAGAGIALRRA